MINAPFTDSFSVTNGYSALHISVIFTVWEDSVSAFVARGPNLHLRGFYPYLSPLEESPTSLAMYSARAFSTWLRALGNADVNLENFIVQELELNYEVHAGWEKETLLELIAHSDRPDLHHPEEWTCNDCLEEDYSVAVQPYWRHLLERIKGRMHPYDPVTSVSEVDEDEKLDLGSPEDTASSSTDLTSKLDTGGSVSFPRPEEESTELVSELELDVQSEADVSENPTLALSESVCLYDILDIVCMNCWLYYKRTGTRKQPDSNYKDSPEAEDSSSSDDSSECEYSPYLIHS